MSKLCNRYWRGAHRFDDFVDQLNAQSHLLLGVRHDETVEILLSVIGELVRARLALLHTALPANADLRAAFTFHLLQAVAARADKKTEEVDLGELFDGDIDLIGGTLGALLLLVFDGRTEVGIVFHGAIDEANALVLKLFAVADFAGVGTATMGIVRGRGRRGSRGEVSRRTCVWHGTRTSRVREGQSHSGVVCG